MSGMRRVVYTLEYTSLCPLLQPFIVCSARLRALQLILQLCALLTPAIEVIHAYLAVAICSINNNTFIKTTAIHFCHQLLSQTSDVHVACLPIVYLYCFATTIAHINNLTAMYPCSFISKFVLQLHLFIV